MMKLLKVLLYESEQNLRNVKKSFKFTLLCSFTFDIDDMKN